MRAVITSYFIIIIYLLSATIINNTSKGIINALKIIKL